MKVCLNMVLFLTCWSRGSFLTDSTSVNSAAWNSLPDGIMRATDVMIGGKTALIAGYGDVGKLSFHSPWAWFGYALYSRPLCRGRHSRGREIPHLQEA